MDDESSAIRQVISRAFAVVGATVHGRDPDDLLDIAEGHAYWILTGTRMPVTNAEARQAVATFCAQAKANLKRKGDKSK